MSAVSSVLTIAREPVISSNLKSIGYHAETKQLDVEFNSGAVYRYSGVPAETHEALIGAESIGRFFLQFVRTKFPSVDLSTPADNEGSEAD